MAQDAHMVWEHIALAIALFVPGLVIYRILLHPLAKFPGPKLAAITRYYEAYYDVVCSGQYTFKIAEMHRLYENIRPIVRISPYELHINDPTFFDQLYSHEKRLDKYDWAYDAFNVKTSTICTTGHEAHRQRRAAVGPFFSKANVANKQQVIYDTVDTLCNRIAECSGSSIMLGHAISAFTRDVAARFILGECHNSLDHPDFDYKLSTFAQSSGSVWILNKHLRWFNAMMGRLPLSWVEGIGDAGVKAFFAYLKDMRKTVTNIMSQPYLDLDSEKPRSLIHDILESNLPPIEKNPDRVFEEISTIAGAAQDTTAHTMRLIIFHIYSNPGILSRLRNELAATMQNEGWLSGNRPTISALEQQKYLTAIITEGLRLSPAIGTRMARISPQDDLHYDNWVIPRGTPVGMTTLFMHMDPTMYPRPTEFIPDRWLDTDNLHRADKVFAPFSRGARICLGMNLTWAELYITIASLVNRFDFEFDGLTPRDFEFIRGQFIIGTMDLGGMKTLTKEREIC
ncbi:cytochrome P450 [Xylaria sp. FL1777]|nr:cytochrome P450 [Xylaria sp. FL1777]